VNADCLRDQKIPCEGIAMSENDSMAEHRRPIPSWLLGLMIAIVVFAIGVLLFQALGFGDNPVIDNATISTLSQ